MTDIPLNIDTPPGVAYTVNRVVYVDKSGRIHMKFAAKICPVVENGVAYVKFLDSHREIKIEISSAELRRLAYEMLGISEQIKKETV